MRTRRTSTAAMKAKGQYPSDRKMKEMAAKMRARFIQAAIAGAIGSIIFYYLLLNHHI